MKLKATLKWEREYEVASGDYPYNITVNDILESEKKYVEDDPCNFFDIDNLAEIVEVELVEE